jgi:hypothetical protein
MLDTNLTPEHENDDLRSSCSVILENAATLCRR